MGDSSEGLHPQPLPDANLTGAFVSTDADDPPQALAPGAPKMVGKYELLKVIGEGGMGTVYLARQTEPVERLVALKLIKGVGASKNVTTRFEAERQALALMDHPNIAKVFDGGTTDEGQPFFVMELVAGERVTDYCDRRRLTPKARLELFVKICRAVQHAHQKGVIHRDLKPGNVLVAEVDGEPVPKVIDFGIAKATDRRLTDESFGDTGALVGTPAYMSPEQAGPDAADVDTRSDVYSLGVVLYELLAGSTPFDPKHAGGALLELFRLIREVAPPRPSTLVGSAETLPDLAARRGVEPARLVRWLRGDIDWIVMKALEKDRERRYPSAWEFAEDIRRHLADEPVLARPPGRGYRLGKFVRRNRGAVVAAALLLFALVAGIVGTSWQAVRARDAERATAQERDDADDARKLAEARERDERKAKDEAVHQKTLAENTRLFFMKVLGRAAGISIDGGPTNPRITVREAIDFAQTLLEKDFRDDPEAEADIRTALGTILGSQGEPDKARDQLAKAQAIYLKLFGEDSQQYRTARATAIVNYPLAGATPDIRAMHEMFSDEAAKTGDHKELNAIIAAMARGGLALQANKPDAAAAEYEAAAAGAEAKYGPEHVVTLTARVAKASCDLQAGRKEKGKADLIALRPRIAKAAGEHSLPGITCDIYLGLAVQETDGVAAAGPHFERAVAAAEKMSLEQFPLMGLAYLGLGVARMNAHKYAESRELALKAEALVRKSPATAPMLPLCHNLLMATSFALKDYDAAAKAAAAVAAGDPHFATAAPNDRWLVLRIWSQSLIESGKFAEADAPLKQFAELCEKHPPAEAVKVASPHVLRFQVAVALDRPAEIDDAVRRIAAACAKADEKARKVIMSDLQNLGRGADASGKPAFAVMAHEEAYRLRKEALGKNDNETCVSAGDLAHTLRKVGKLDRCEELCREAFEGTKVALGAAHEHTRLCADNLIYHYRQAKRPDDALAVRRTLYEWVSKEKGPSNEITRKRGGEFVALCKELGRAGDGVETARALLASTLDATGDDGHATATARVILGQCLLESGNGAGAVEPLRLALEFSRKQKPEPAFAAINEEWFGEALLAAKKYAEAEPLLLSAHGKLKPRPAVAENTSAGRAAAALVRLYTEWGKPEKATEWKPVAEKK